MMKPELSSSAETLSQCDAWILLIVVSTPLRQVYCFFHLVPFDH
jgi:hypothetical protein